MERRHIYGGGITLAGLILTGVQLVQGIQQSTRPIVFAFESAPFVLVALSLAVIGAWVTREKQYEPQLPVVVAWGVGSVIIFASLGSLLLFSQQVTMNTLENAPYVAMNMVTVGAVVGTLVGIYDARGRISLAELEQERDRVEEFANKAADVNNYGRALNQFDSVDEVSSLCIQAMQALLGISEVAVVVQYEDSSEIVDNTILNVDEEVLFEVAPAPGDQTESAVLIRESPPGVDQPKDVVSVLVTAHDDSSVAVVALTEDTSTFEEEDVELLEMLMAHAGIALDRIHDAAEVTPAESV